MIKDNLQKALPYAIAILVFLAITIIYFSPLLEGKKLKQHDHAMFKGMSKEIVDYRTETGEEALWTNSMFGGMPAWQISVIYNGNLMRYVDKALMLGLPYPANYVFLYFLGFFILLLVLKVDKWVALVGAIGFALSSYLFIILGAGHSSKAHAIGYMAPVLAGIILAFDGKYIKGALLTAAALSLEILSGHLQITYYLLLMVVIYGIYQLVVTISDKNYTHFFKASGLLIVAALLAVSTHTTNLWATYEYGKDTMRGEPELTNDPDNKSNGLDRDYITHWSYGIGETWSFLIPNAKGGGSALIGNHKQLDKADPAYRNFISQQGNAYWGDQPGTSGPVYLGAIIMFLFVLGMFVVHNRLKWALLAMAILSILLSWGNNFMGFTNFFIDYIPGYNKFRAVTMILVIAELAIPILAFMALDQLIRNKDVLKKNPKAFYWAAGLTAAVTGILYLMPTLFFNFLSSFEAQQLLEMSKGPDSAQMLAFLSSLEAVRIGIFKADAGRSLIYILLGAGMIYLFIIGKIQKIWLVLILAVLVTADMATINRRYLNNDNFVRGKQVDIPFQASQANKAILSDNDPDFRVLDVSKSTFNDASCSYFHKSIGGYHGAKLQRYQDLINVHIQDEITAIAKTFQKGVSAELIDRALSQQQVLNMLNMKYMIYNADAQPISNRHAFGHAWFVNELAMVSGADEEIAALSEYDLKKTAVVDERFKEGLSQLRFVKDSTASILLTSYSPKQMDYKYQASSDQMLVFSAIYFKNGWNAYLDGEKVDYVRANYVLRAMTVPAGAHDIVFKFEPVVWMVGEKVSLAGSLLLILLVLGYIGVEVKKAMGKA